MPTGGCQPTLGTFLSLRRDLRPTQVFSPGPGVLSIAWSAPIQALTEIFEQQIEIRIAGTPIFEMERIFADGNMTAYLAAGLENADRWAMIGQPDTIESSEGLQFKTGMGGDIPYDHPEDP